MGIRTEISADLIQTKLQKAEDNQVLIQPGNIEEEFLDVVSQNYSGFGDVGNIAGSSGLPIEASKATRVLKSDKRERIELREELVNKSVGGGSGVDKNKSRNFGLGNS